MSNNKLMLWLVFSYLFIYVASSNDGKIDYIDDFVSEELKISKLENEHAGGPIWTSVCKKLNQIEINMKKELVDATHNSERIKILHYYYAAYYYFISLYLGYKFNVPEIRHSEFFFNYLQPYLAPRCANTVEMIRFMHTSINNAEHGAMNNNVVIPIDCFYYTPKSCNGNTLEFRRLVESFLNLCPSLKYVFIDKSAFRCHYYLGCELETIHLEQIVPTSYQIFYTIETSAMIISRFYGADLNHIAAIKTTHRNGINTFQFRDADLTFKKEHQHILFINNYYPDIILIQDCTVNELNLEGLNVEEMLKIDIDNSNLCCPINWGKISLPTAKIETLSITLSQLSTEVNVSDLHCLKNASMVNEVIFYLAKSDPMVKVGAFDLRPFTSLQQIRFVTYNGNCFHFEHIIFSTLTMKLYVTNEENYIEIQDLEGVKFSISCPRNHIETHYRTAAVILINFEEQTIKVNNNTVPRMFKFPTKQ